MTTRVVLVRGHLVNQWELPYYERLPPRFSVSYLRTRSNSYDEGPTALAATPINTRRDYLPRGVVGDVAARLVGDRYLNLGQALAGADIVHSEELGFWFSGQAARMKSRYGYRLVLTVWETIPYGSAFRSGQPGRSRAAVIENTDLFLAITQRSADALVLEGVTSDRIEVCPPGIDVDRFRKPGRGYEGAEHVVLSVGRLVWEKGHQDVIRAIAALHRGLVASPASPRLVILGRGPERDRLLRHAKELGIAQFVEVRAVPYEEMPQVLADASCLVLASLPAAWSYLHMRQPPQVFWEEQFGLVLVEAMAAGLFVVASTSGAMPEVLGEGPCRWFAPGDWMSIASALARGPLASPPGTRVEHDAGRLERFSVASAGKRLAAAYDRVLGSQR